MDALPVGGLRLSIGTLLAADAAYLGAALAMKVQLVKADFTPNENLILVSSFTLANFTGATALTAGAAPQLTGIDPLTQEQMITIKEPAGGWRWVPTDSAQLPQTIYGFIVMDNAGTGVVAMAKFPAPIPLSSPGMEIDVGEIKLRIVLKPIG